MRTTRGCTSHPVAGGARGGFHFFAREFSFQAPFSTTSCVLRRFPDVPVPLPFTAAAAGASAKGKKILKVPAKKEAKKETSESTEVVAPSKRQHTKSAAQKVKGAASAKAAKKRIIESEAALQSNRRKTYRRKARAPAPNGSDGSEGTISTGGTRVTRSAATASQGRGPITKKGGKRKLASSSSSSESASDSESNDIELPRKRMKRAGVLASREAVREMVSAEPAPKGKGAMAAKETAPSTKQNLRVAKQAAKAVEEAKIAKADAAARAASADAARSQQKLARLREQALEAEKAAADAAEKAAELAQAAEQARTPLAKPPAPAVDTWEILICWDAVVLPLKMRGDSTVGSVAVLISRKTGGKLVVDRCDLRFGVTRLRSVPNEELLASLGVRNGARLVLSLLPKIQPALPPPSPGLTPAAIAAAKARRDAAYRRTKELDMDRRVSLAGAEPTPEPKRALGSRWTGEEADALLDGVARFGLGEWAQVLKAIWGKRVDFPKRSSTDLKDKWRNLVVSTTKPEGFKFRAQYVTPALLAKTKEVMEAAEKMKELDEAREAAEMRAKRAAVVAAQRSAPGV